jgi:hypothetical protein
MKLSRSWLCLLLVVPLAFGIARLRFDTEILNLLPENLAVAQGLKSYQRNFSSAQELVITLEAAVAEEAESAARALAQVLRRETNLVANVMWQPAWMEDPAQAAELVAFLWVNQPTPFVAELTNRLAPENLSNVLDEAREQLATSLSPGEIVVRGYDPYGLMRLPEAVSGAASGIGTGEELFASNDGTFRMIFVQAKPHLTNYRACNSWLAEICRILDAAQRSGEVPRQAQLQFT